ncbi:MAG: sulfur carrier protein ThiS [Deltaproteobacteria bacterium]|nr:sulfur carrier protein ThiS [Deltaproteobacteria bacterium]
MIRVQLNGQHKALNDSTGDSITLEKLVGLLKVNSKNIAIAVNLSVIPRSQFPRIVIKDGDAIDIIQASAGG